MTEKEFAIHYFPKLYFDNNEPLMPIKIGYQVYEFDENRFVYNSPTFARIINSIPELNHVEDMIQQVIEYSLWYDADISHLYELEHLWVYVSSEGSVIKVEGSRHGEVRELDLEQKIYVEPGKHGHFQGELVGRIKDLANVFAANPGSTGLISRIVCPDLFEFNQFLQKHYKKTEIDVLIKEDFKKYRFEPSFRFERIFEHEENMFIPWEELREYIVDYVLEKIISLRRK